MSSSKSSANYSILPTGTVIAERLTVTKFLGSGLMGMVYACKHKGIANRLVALKVLFPNFVKDAVSCARFRHEIVATYGISHPHVVKAFEYIRDGDIVAYTMEHVDAGDLADKLESTGRLTLKDTIRIMMQICSGLEAIHDAHIVHRDLKPENILLTQSGDVKIADFGIARSHVGPRVTAHGGVLGTIDYVSPEYMESGSFDVRSDIYAVGVLGYEMLLGESPFKHLKADSVVQGIKNRLAFVPPPPSAVRHACPAVLDAIILKALERDPNKRFQSAREMFTALQELSSRADDTSQAYSNMVEQAA